MKILVGEKDVLRLDIAVYDVTFVLIVISNVL